MTPQFITDRHLGGYIARSGSHPHGDWWTWCPSVWDWMAATFNLTTLIDVGCGEGHAIRYMLDHCCIDATGIDGMASARQAGIVPPERILVHDFEQSVPETGHPDVIWSCEFVEHVEAEYVDNFLAVFHRAQKAVLMTHAEPGQQGYHHVNCQPAEYWISRMRARGFRLDQELTDHSRKLAPRTHWERSGLVFVR
jgi:cyclopropane fatty-acyl-phospholipid synthase-like methyltransferase